MRILKPLLLTCLITATIAAAHAESKTPTAIATAVAAKSPPVPLLWKVSDNDNALYLLGSFHLLKPDDYPLSKDVHGAFADAESLVFELTPEEMASPALGVTMAQAALRSDGKQLKDELSPELTGKLDAWVMTNQSQLQKTGLTSEILQRFEPWFVGLMITIAEMTKHGLDTKLGLDNHLANAAKAANKPTTGLETGAQQVALFDGMSAQEQTQFLDETLSEAASGRREIEKLHAAWRNGDTQLLWNEMATEMRQKYPQLYRRINTDRNDAWVPELEQRLTQPGKDDTLVVVGALHLLGNDGVVEKLRAKGYRVERVCSACSKTK